MKKLVMPTTGVVDSKVTCSNSQYGLIHPQISLITHTCPAPGEKALKIC
jgi:hypothetical protein